MATGYKHYAGVQGGREKHVGPDADVYQYTSLADAFSDAKPNDIIHLHGGTYTLTSAVTVDYSVHVVGHGKVSVTGDVADRLFMLNKPAAGSSETRIVFEGIDFSNSNASADVFEIDNDGGGTGDLVVRFRDCSVDAGASGLAFDVDQSTNTIDLFLSVSARLADKLVMDGLNLDCSKAGSHVIFEGYDFGASVAALGTTNVAWIFELINCQYESAAFTSGGSASLIFNAQGCSKISSGALVAPVIEDFDATVASENVQIGTLDV